MTPKATVPTTEEADELLRSVETDTVVSLRAIAP